MTGMGRPRSKHLDLPPRMYARRLKSKTLYYYGKARIPLGDDLNKARQEWARLENGTGGGGFLEVANAYINEGMAGLSPKTRKEYESAIETLKSAFGKFALEEIEPSHVRQYLHKRSAKVAANREVAVLSIIWNFARGLGYTSLANPCKGIKRNREAGRDVYVTDDIYRTVWNNSPAWLQDAMDLALLTAQRPGDVLKMTRQDIQDGRLWVKQDKRKARLRIRIEGELKTVVDRILTRPRAVQSMYLICDEKGQKISIWRLDKAFAKARGNNDWQFRDLRPKSTTDEEDLRTASQRAGHADEAITAKVYRRIKGNEVGPLK